MYVLMVVATDDILAATNDILVSTIATPRLIDQIFTENLKSIRNQLEIYSKLFLKRFEIYFSDPNWFKSIQNLFYIHSNRFEIDFKKNSNWFEFE